MDSCYADEMNRHDVTFTALVAIMVVAVATAVTARHPGANFGSVADWFAAVGTIVAAVSALYIAHHEARRAREVLAEERSTRRLERLRSDAIAVQTANAALSTGLESCAGAMKSVAGRDEKDRSSYTRAFLESARFTVPTSELAMISPTAAFMPETAKHLSAVKGGWGICLTRMSLVADPGLTNDRVPIVAAFDDIGAVLRSGHILLWRLEHDQFDGPVPDAVLEGAEAATKFDGSF